MLARGVPSDTAICWQPGRPLTWADFTVRRRPAEDPAPGLGSKAVVSYVHAVVYQVAGAGSPPPVVRALFTRSRSWVRAGAVFDRRAGLRHEQLHFDLAELSARKLRALLAEYAAAGRPAAGPAFEQRVYRLYAQEDNWQRRYDQETVGGSDPAAQARWQLLVAKELRKWASYQSTACDCQD